MDDKVKIEIGISDISKIISSEVKKTLKDEFSRYMSEKEAKVKESIPYNSVKSPTLEKRILDFLKKIQKHYDVLPKNCIRIIRHDDENNDGRYIIEIVDPVASKTIINDVIACIHIRKSFFIFNDQRSYSETIIKDTFLYKESSKILDDIIDIQTNKKIVEIIDIFSKNSSLTRAVNLDNLE